MVRMPRMPETAGEPAPAARPAKPRVLQDGRDMFWSLAPLVLGMHPAGRHGRDLFVCAARDEPGTDPDVQRGDGLACRRCDAGFPDSTAAIARGLAAELRRPGRYREWPNRAVDRPPTERGHLDCRIHQPDRNVSEPDAEQRRRGQTGGPRSTLLSFRPERSTSQGTNWVAYQGAGQSGANAEPIWTTRLAGPTGAAQIAVTGAGSPTSSVRWPRRHNPSHRFPTQ